MRRWGLALALLLSVGVNIGILATLAVRHTAAPDAPQERPGPVEPPSQEPRPIPSGPVPPGPISPGMDEPPPRAARLADRLGLEGEPRHRFLEIQTQFFAETVRLRTEQAETFRALRRELTATEPDRQRIDELTQASARTHLGLQQAMAKNVLATRAILNPEQERVFLDVISRLVPPGLGGAPEPQRRLPLRPQRPQRRPWWRRP